MDLHFEIEFDKLLSLKNLMRAAGGFVRSLIQNCGDHPHLISSQTLTVVARAVWAQSVPLAETLLKHSGFAREHLKISEGNVHIIDLVLFSDIADRSSTALLTEGTNAFQAVPRPSERKIETIANLAQLSIPMSKPVILAGIKLDGTSIRSEPELSFAMGNA